MRPEAMTIGSQRESVFGDRESNVDKGESNLARDEWKTNGPAFRRARCPVELE